MRKNKSRWHEKRALLLPRLSPSTVVCLVAAVVVLLLIFGGSLQRFFTDRLYPDITFQQGRERSRRREGSVNKSAQPIVFDGEVYRTEGRLREASAIAIAATLSGIASITEQHPLHNVTELLNSMVKRGLLPPGVVFVADRSLLVSEHSTIYVRLRPAPFAVEIVSIGRERLDGPALLLRVPDDRQNTSAPARYFYSLTLETIKVPEPFALPSAILACGWQSAIIKPELIEGVNPERLAAWATEIQQR